MESTRQPPDGADDVLLGPFRRSGTVAATVEFLTEQLGLRQCSGPLRERYESSEGSFQNLCPPSEEWAAGPSPR